MCGSYKGMLSVKQTSFSFYSILYFLFTFFLFAYDFLKLNSIDQILSNFLSVCTQNISSTERNKPNTLFSFYTFDFFQLFFFFCYLQIVNLLCLQMRVQAKVGWEF